jgi:hypothetical protein
MQSIIYRIGNAITSLGAVIVALLLTIVANVFFSHTVFYQALPDTMIFWEKSLAAYAIAISYEMTLLIVVCNTELLSNKRIPIVLSICSGLVILFFIQAFEPNLTIDQYLQRWFIAALLTIINLVFTSLFYRKWCASTAQVNLSKQVSDLLTTLTDKDKELISIKARLNEADSKLTLASSYIVELEEFKAIEIGKLTCSCGQRFDSVYKLSSHRATCGHPKHEAKMVVNHAQQ